MGPNPKQKVEPESEEDDDIEEFATSEEEEEKFDDDQTVDEVIEDSVDEDEQDDEDEDQELVLQNQPQTIEVDSGNFGLFKIVSVFATNMSQFVFTIVT